MNKTRVAINGFGRIGRSFYRAVHNADDIEVVAINDLADGEQLAYLLNYDTAYGRGPFVATYSNRALSVDDRSITVLNEKEPGNLPWADLNVDVVIESTGVFRNYEQASPHITAGAKRVLITAPVKNAHPENDAITMLVGVNEERGKTCPITSNASCTTNAASPLIGILNHAIGVERALLNTVHAYTASQSLVDGPQRDMRRGRAAAQNIIPTSTGAAIATTKAHTDLTDKFDGIALRVPVVAGSIVDITFDAARSTSVEEINQILTDGAGRPEWREVFAVTNEPIVSSDIIGAPYAAIADLSMTRVVDGTLVKVLAWYDNEAGYAHTLVTHLRSLTATAGEPEQSS